MSNFQYNRDKEFLGQGFAFPFQLSPSGKAMLVSGAKDIEQAIRIILGTVPGERLMRPEFGCKAHDLIFAPRDATTQGLLIHYVEEALARWEPRIETREVVVKNVPDPDGALLVEISYTIKATHDERSIVYPFFLVGREG